MKRFEEKLTDNITTAFDAFQEEMDMGAFKDIQSRLRRRNRKVVWLPWLIRGAAAVVVAISSFFIWHLYFGPQANSPMETDQKMSILLDNYSTDRLEDQTEISEKSTVVTSETAETYKISSSIETELAKETFIQKKKRITESDHNSSVDHSTRSTQKEKISPFIHTDKNDEAFPNALSVAAIRPSSSYQVLLPLPRLTPWIFSEKSIQPIFFLLPEVNFQKNETVRKESSFSLLAGIHGSVIQNQVAGNKGLKVGGRYQVPLKNGFALNVGLLVNHIRLGYDPKLGIPLSFDALEVDTSIDFHSFEIEEVNWVGARLWSLEIPIQMDYSWRHTNGGLYRLSAGFSSFWQMRQRFEIDQTVYTVETEIISISEMKITDIRRETVFEDFAPFQRFDPLAMFNLTFAFPIKMSSRYIYLEPYIQLPISSQTSRAIRFGSGGVQIVFPILHTKNYSK